MPRGRVVLLTVCLFACPLVFFTNLTRNPYITQICLLNLAVLGGAAAWLWRRGRDGALALPRTPVDAPLAAFAGACALSWAVAYAGHAPFFRPAMAAEGAKAFLFLAFNALAPFALGVLCARESGEDGEVPLGAWTAFALLWGAAWALYPYLRRTPADAGIWSQVWDGYGAALWAAGLAGAGRLCRRGRWSDFLHLAFAAGFLASAYAVLQYFNVELIWPQALNPYGGRSVSTFGNPNFMSSFMLMLLPAAAVHFLRSRGPRRLVYGALFLTLEAALLSSLTRSSWVGALAGLLVLALCPEARRLGGEAARPAGLLAFLAAGLALAWPQSTIATGYAPSVIGRLAEVGEIAKGETPYSPWHQRLLIWTCAWQMGAENPLTGKGYGLFELFYPFYQGPLLEAFPRLQSMRTHANNAHNEVMEVWAQAGLLGLGAILWALAAFAAACRRAYFSERGRDALGAAAAAGAAGMLVDGLLNVSLHFTVPAFLFWFLAGSALGRIPPGTEPERRAPVPAGAARGLSAAGAVLLLALGSYWVRTWAREAHYFAGFKLVRQGPMSAAIRHLEASRRWGPREVNAVYELGNAYAKSERYLEAGEAFREALRANAGYDEIYYNLATLLSQRLGLTEQGLDHYRMAWWINPSAPDIYAGFGNLLIQRGAPSRAEAVRLMESATRLFPENANHWNNLGYLHTLDRRFAEAARAYERALSIDPGMTVAATNLATLARQAGGPEPATLAALRDLRELEGRLARKDSSAATLELAARLSERLPGSAKLRFYHGTLLLARGRAAEAVLLLESVVAREAKNPWARVNLGHAYRLAGRTEEARGQFRTALELDPGNAAAMEGLRFLAPK